MLVTKQFPCTRGLTRTQTAFPNDTDFFFFSYILFVVHSRGQRATLDPFWHWGLTSQARLFVFEHILLDYFLPGAGRWQDWPNLFSAFVVFRVSSDDGFSLKPKEGFPCHIKEYVIKIFKKKNGLKLRRCLHNKDKWWLCLQLANRKLELEFHVLRLHCGAHAQWFWGYRLHSRALWDHKIMGELRTHAGSLRSCDNWQE